jgi:hypothetical protein
VKKKILVQIEIECSGNKCGKCSHLFWVAEICTAPSFCFPKLKRIGGDLERCDACKAAEVKG